MKNNVFIAGFEKCGTTTLHQILARHFMICEPKEKEPQFFERYYHEGERGYLERYFPPTVGENMLFLDSRPYNSIIGYVRERISEMCENPKFIFIIREPISRSFSGLINWDSMRPGRGDRSYSKAMRRDLADFNPFENLYELERDWITDCDHKGGPYRSLLIQNGMYWTHVKKFISLFGEESVFVATLDELSNNPVDLCNRIFNFLGIPSIPTGEIPHANKTAPCGVEIKDIPRIIYESDRELFWMLFETFYFSSEMIGSHIGRDLTLEWYGDLIP